jgi:hypothetical protein
MNIFYLKRKRVGREQTSREKEREREKERKRDRALLEKGMAWVLKQVIYEGQRKDNPGPYQDDNKAFPMNFRWLMFF